MNYVCKLGSFWTLFVRPFFPYIWERDIFTLLADAPHILLFCSHFTMIYSESNGFHIDAWLLSSVWRERKKETFFHSRTKMEYSMLQCVYLCMSQWAYVIERNLFVPWILTLTSHILCAKQVLKILIWYKHSVFIAY